MRTRVKFCGLTRVEDVAAAVELGVDAIGVVFVPGTARQVTLDQARRLVAAVRGLVPVVALFRDPEPAAVEQVLAELRPGLLQFHGAEPPEFCLRFRWPYLKAVPMAEPQDLLHWLERHRQARALVLDSHAAGGLGGSGRPFDWQRIPPELAPHCVLAGGLGPDNVAEAIRRVGPHAVDVSSGIESAPGRKDVEKMQRFMQEVRSAEFRSGGP